MADLDFIYEWLERQFEEPCNYTFDGRDVAYFMHENCGSWCENNCGQVKAKECWKSYFKKLMEIERKKITWK